MKEKKKIYILYVLLLLYCIIIITIIIIICDEKRYEEREELERGPQHETHCPSIVLSHLAQPRRPFLRDYVPANLRRPKRPVPYRDMDLNFFSPLILYSSTSLVGW